MQCKQASRNLLLAMIDFSNSHRQIRPLDWENRNLQKPPFLFDLYDLDCIYRNHDQKYCWASQHISTKSACRHHDSQMPELPPLFNSFLARPWQLAGRWVAHCHVHVLRMQTRVSTLKSVKGTRHKNSNS